MDNNLKRAGELQEKFEFYFIALVFTILGLSIQTAHLKPEGFQYLFEILSWFLLTVSGLVGLSRLEWLPVAYRYYSRIQKEKENKVLLERASYGKIPMVDEYGSKYGKTELDNKVHESQNCINLNEMELNSLEKKQLWKYQIHTATFRLGIVSLVVSRIISNIILL